MKEGVDEARRITCLKAIADACAAQGLSDQEGSVELTTTASVRVDQALGLTFDGLVKSRVAFADETTNGLNSLSMADLLSMKGPQAGKMQSLSDCLAVNLPILLTTDDTTKMIKCLTLMAGVKNAKLRRILLSDRSDTTQLLGCFEQTSQDLSPVLRHLEPYKR